MPKRGPRGCRAGPRTHWDLVWALGSENNARSEISLSRTRWGVLCVLVGPFLPEGSAPHDIFLPAPPPRGPCISQSGCGMSGFHAGYLHPRHHEPRRQVRRLCLGASLTMSLTDQLGESCEPLRKNKSV